MTATGMTKRQAEVVHFYHCLDAYRTALRTGENIVRASIAVHAAAGCFSQNEYRRQIRPLINRTFRDTKREQKES